MSYGVLIIFLSFSLCACNDFCVDTFLQYPIDDCNSVTVICQHNAHQSQKMGANVYTGKNTVCDMLNENKNECEFSSEGNQFRFTLKNLTTERKKLLYYCKVYTIVPPVVVVEGGNFHLVPGCNVSCPRNVVCPRSDIKSEGFFSFVSPLILALVGTVALMCGYGVIITIFYFRLRRSSEEPTMTYVPMQKPKRRVKGNDNTEYMDMRKVQQQAGPIRDLNHNSPGINGRHAL